MDTVFPWVHDEDVRLREGMAIDDDIWFVVGSRRQHPRRDGVAQSLRTIFFVRSSASENRRGRDFADAASRRVASRVQGIVVDLGKVQMSDDKVT